MIGREINKSELQKLLTDYQGRDIYVKTQSLVLNNQAGYRIGRYKLEKETVGLCIYENNPKVIPYSSINIRDSIRKIHTWVLDMRYIEIFYEKEVITLMINMNNWSSDEVSEKANDN